MLKIKIFLSSVFAIVLASFTIGTTYASHVNVNANANVGIIEELKEASSTSDFNSVRARGDVIVEAGNSFWGAVISGKLYMWGDNSYGQLGLGHVSHVYSPTIVPGIGSVSELSISDSSVCAINYGVAHTWGKNDYGQLGLGHKSNQSRPTQINNLAGSSVKSIAMSPFHGGIIANNHIYMWGLNDRGQLGDKSYDDRLNPVSVDMRDLPAALPLKLSLGTAHSAAVVQLAGMQAGMQVVMTWGDNKAFSELGYSVSPWLSRDYPTVVPAISSYGTMLLSAKGSHTIAASGNTIWTWGRNSWGQLGIGKQSNWEWPQTISYLSGITSVAAGTGSSAVVANSWLYTWGYNGGSDLGTGDLTNRSSPTSIISGNISDINLDTSTSCAVIDGKIRTWGSTSSSTPTIINIYESATIQLDSANDPKNLRSKVAYNHTNAEIISLLEFSSYKMNLPRAGTYSLDSESRIGATPYNSSLTGQISIRAYSSSFPIYTSVVIRGFVPVNETANADIDRNKVSISDTTDFIGIPVNTLVDNANADTSGKNHKLPKWIIANTKLFFDVQNSYTVDFPKNAKIVRLGDYEAVKNDNTWLIKFSVYVDRYYHKSGSNLVETTGELKLKSSVTLAGLPQIVSREECVDDKNQLILFKEEIEPNVTADKFFLAITGDVNGGLVTNRYLLSQYIDIRYIPGTASITITRNVFNQSRSTEIAQEIGFVLTANEIINNHGWLLKGDSALDIEEKVNFKLKLKLSNITLEDDSQSKVKNITTGDFLDKIAPNNNLNFEAIDQYLIFDTFPGQTSYRFLNETINNNNELGKLNFELAANQFYDTSSFSPIIQSKNFTFEETSFLPAYDMTDWPVVVQEENMGSITSHNKFYDALMINEDAVNFDYLAKLIDIRSFPQDADVTIQRLDSGGNSNIEFIVKSNKYYDNGGRTIVAPFAKTFTISISQINTILITLLVGLGLFVTFFIITTLICRHNRWLVFRDKDRKKQPEIEFDCE